MISSKISDIIRMPISLLVALVLTVSMCLSAMAESADEFTKKVDTRLSVKFLKTKDDRKLKDNKQLAIYQIIDVSQSTGENVPMTDDVVELVIKKGEAGKKDSKSGLPWAKVEPDGMIKVQLPKAYLKKRAKSSAKTFWRIDNKDSKFALVKP